MFNHTYRRIKYWYYLRIAIEKEARNNRYLSVRRITLIVANSVNQIATRRMNLSYQQRGVFPGYIALIIPRAC